MPHVAAAPQKFVPFLSWEEEKERKGRKNFDSSGIINFLSAFGWVRRSGEFIVWETEVGGRPP